MNRSQLATQRQDSPNRKLNTSTVDDSVDDEFFPPVPYSDPSWFLSPFEHNGRTGDQILWELTEQTDQVEQLDAQSPNGRRAVRHG